MRGNRDTIQQVSLIITGATFFFFCFVLFFYCCCYSQHFHSLRLFAIPQWGDIAWQLVFDKSIALYCKGL